MNSRSRNDFVRCLIEFSEPLRTIALELNKFGYDFDGTPEILTRVHVLSILDRYLNGSLSSQQVYDWADIVEVRADIEFEPAFDEEINEAVYELANPLLTWPLTKASALSLKTKLSHLG